MAVDVCRQTETRAVRLARDAERARAKLARHARKSPSEMIGQLSLEECLTLSHQRWLRVFEEESETFAAEPDMAPMPVFLPRAWEWEPSE